jgi:hypothetical protein
VKGEKNRAAQRKEGELESPIVSARLHGNFSSFETNPEIISVLTALC